MAQNTPQPDPKTSGKRILRSTSVVGGMTLLSRVLGLVRDVVFARMFGATFAMDAFFVAFKIPNIFRRFFAEGAFSQAFVPVFTEYDQNRSKDEVRELADRVAGTLGISLFVFTAAGVLAAPLLIAVFAPGFISNGLLEDGNRYALAVDMLRLTFPYLFFISMTALAGGILNTYHRFAAAAFAPVLLNIVLIIFAAFIAPGYSRPGIALALGVFVAGVVQLLFMLPFLGHLKLMPRPRWGAGHAGVKKILKLMAPAVFGSSVAQINILFDTLIASFLATGSISWLYYSDRLMEFPLGVFGIALATVILPNLSRHHAADSKDNFSAMLEWAIRLMILIAVPAAAGLFVLAEPLLTTIFYGGRFVAGDVTMAGMSLMAYAFGLVGFIMVKVLVPGYFARQDTRTPVRIGIKALGVNMGLNIVIVVPWVMGGYPGPHTGLAVATSLSAFLNAGLLYRGLRREGVLERAPQMGKFLLRVVVAAALMVMLLWNFLPVTAGWLEATLLIRCLWLAASIASGGLIYFGALYAMGIRLSDFRMSYAGTQALRQ